jgi:uncharacterized protein YbjT (DUF2867 family)
MARSDRTIVVTGATGHQGSTAVRHLLEAGFDVRGISRNPQGPRAQALEGLGAEIVRGDLDDPRAIRRDLEGAHGVFCVLPWMEGGPAVEAKQGKMVSDAAKDAGVEHFVYSSVGGAERNTGIPHFESKWQTEWHIRDIGLPWSVIRPVSFMENYNAPQNVQAIMSGELINTLDLDKELQMIATEDIGFFAAIIFDNKNDWLGKAIEVAGDSLTMPQVAEVLSREIKRPVEYYQQELEGLDISDDGYRMLSWMNESGYNADIAALRKLHPGLMTFEQWLQNGYWRGSRVKERVPA